ncbi:AtpZ/AtpI family protein [Rhizosaccharibacter radicis]|uniref:ATP synthase protein I n=1 Tax=Rhizosaccharibacter radicis TaxID=2782605 RepID=A0ABT1VZA3_9PROT|nr:AtpZ/AtpI family protein [Acetobacteraceae bacterium KSS12]
MNEDGTGPSASFDRRLSAARARQGLDSQPAMSAPSTSEKSPVAMFLRVGVELVSAVAVGVAIGWGIDRLLGTRPFLLILFAFLGGVAGIINIWRLVAPAPEQGRAP